MSKISNNKSEKRDLFIGMIVAAVVSLIFWGLISLGYSGHSDTDYKLTPVLIFFCLPIHLILLAVVSLCFKPNTIRLKGFILGVKVAFGLVILTSLTSNIVIFANVSVPANTLPLLSLVFFIWILILLALIYTTLK